MRPERSSGIKHFLIVASITLLLPLEEGEEEDNNPFPTLEEPAAMVKEKQNNDIKLN